MFWFRRLPFNDVHLHSANCDFMVQRIIYFMVQRIIYIRNAWQKSWMRETGGWGRARWVGGGGGCAEWGEGGRRGWEGNGGQ